MAFPFKYYHSPRYHSAALVIGFQELTYDFAEPDPGTSRVTEEVCIEVTEGRIGTDLTIIVTWTPVSASLGNNHS